MKPATRRRLAIEIAADLFTNGHGEKAEWLTMFSAAGIDLGARGEAAVASRIEQLLAAAER